MSETYTFHVNSYINVPLNDRGRRAVTEENEYVEFINEDFSSMRYSDEASMALTELFFAYNDTFNIMIDDCEDELLHADKVEQALTMAKAYLQKAKDDHRTQIEQFIKLLELALRTGMPVSFNL